VANADLPPVLTRGAIVPDLTTEDNGVTFMVVCAGGPFVWVLRRLQAELDAGRRVNVVATPRAAAWFDHYGVTSTIEAMTGWPVRHQLPTPTAPTFRPAGSSVLVSPCTLNTLTKWADGHCDNLAISLLCEAVGRGVPTRAEISVSGPYAGLPATAEALSRLEALGVELVRAMGTTEPTTLPQLEADLVDLLGADPDGGGLPN